MVKGKEKGRGTGWSNIHNQTKKGSERAKTNQKHALVFWTNIWENTRGGGGKVRTGMGPRPSKRILEKLKNAKKKQIPREITGKQKLLTEIEKKLKQREA